jgi:hypothetical protein
VLEVSRHGRPIWFNDARPVHAMCPEQELWVGVVTQAMQEAVIMLGSGVAASRRQSKDAWVWLFHPRQERDFFEVCFMAGLKPCWVREQVKRYWADKDYRQSAVPLIHGIKPWEHLVSLEAA